MIPPRLVLLLALVSFAYPALAQDEVVVPVSEAFEAALKAPPSGGGWAQATSWEVKPLPRMASAGAPAVTKAWAAACSKGLLLAVSCPKGTQGSEDAKVRDPARDASIYRDPSIELFLWPTSSDKEYFQFAVGMGSRGAVSDAHFAEGVTGAQALKWNGEGVASHVVSGPQGWTATFLVPWADLGLKGRPMDGYVIRAKVVRNMPNEATTYRWPVGTAESHHAAQDFGFLVIGDKNLVENGGFEDAGRNDAEAKGWMCPNELVNGKPAGSIARTAEAAHEGKAGMRMIREAVTMHWPQLNQEVEVQADSTYRISCWVRGEGQLYLRWNVRGEKLGTVVNLTGDWMEHSAEFEVPEGVTRIGIGAQLKGPGRFDLDEVRLVRENAKDAGPGLTEAHPLHRLLAVACQRPFVPFGQLSEGGGIDLQPLFVQDSVTERWLVRWARSARHRYSDMPPFNANGTMIAFNAGWKGKSFWIADLRTGKAREVPVYSSRWIWDRTDPDRLYAATGGNAVQVIRASENRASMLATFDGVPGLSNISWDGKLLIVQVDHADGKKSTSEAVWIRAEDGKVVGKYDFKKQIHAMFFTKHPSNSIAAGLEDLNDPDAAKGFVVTPEGKVTRVAFPGGHISWAPGGEGIAFFGGGAFVCKADGTGIRRVMPYTSQHLEWNVTPEWFLTSAPRGIFRIWPSTPSKWERVAVPNSDLFGNRSYYTENHVAASPDGTSCAFASQMLGTGDFWAAVIEPPMPAVNLKREKALGGGAVLFKWDKPERAREITDWQVYALDGEDKVHPVATTKGATQLIVPKEWAEADLFVTGLQSWGLEGRPSERVDATGGLQPVTEAAFAARFAPAAVKSAPRLLRKESSLVELSWEPANAPGFWHYRVHRGLKPDFTPSVENLVGTPREPQFIDWGLPAVGPWTYKVAVVAHNGAVSAPSEGLTVSVEKPGKRILVDVPVNWRSSDKESVEVPVTLPSAGRCVVWLRLSSGKPQRGAKIDLSVDGAVVQKGLVEFGPVSRGHAGAVADMPMWQAFVNTVSWTKEDFGHALSAGNHRIGLRAEGTSALQVTRLVVTDDLTWAPGELWKMIPPEMTQPKP